MHHSCRSFNIATGWGDFIATLSSYQIGINEDAINPVILSPARPDHPQFGPWRGSTAHLLVSDSQSHGVNPISDEVVDNRRQMIGC